MFLSQLPAVENDTEKCAPGKFLGPSYFETALALDPWGSRHVKFGLKLKIKRLKCLCAPNAEMSNITKR